MNKTMTLRQVRNMGTEGRRKGENEVEGGDKILGTVKFRVDLIKHFKILKENEEQPTPKESEPEMDPAIVETEPVGDTAGT